MPFNMRSHAAILILGLLVSFPAYAQQGMNSSPGTNLPIGAGGNTSVWVTPNGNVGIGTQNPQTTLDVNGGIRSGNGTIGTACPLEGVFGYDLNNHQPIYCNANGIWTPMSSSSAQSGVVSPALMNGSSVVNVAFAKPFSSPPVVMAAPTSFFLASHACSSAWGQAQVSVSNVTTTGFTLTTYEYWPGDGCNQSKTLSVQWMAAQ